jgi:RNA recognition motif-containing protein
VPTNVPGQAVPLTEAATELESAAKENKTRAPRVQKQRGPPEDGIPSKTKVMVANLPYDLDEEKVCDLPNVDGYMTTDSNNNALQLKELFKDYEPQSAKIALRPIPRFMIKKLQARNEPRKGRGFGFVTLGSEALQEKAVQEMNGKEIEGREIVVKVAIDSPGKEDVIPGEGDEQAAEEAAEPAAEEAGVAA